MTDGIEYTIRLDKFLRQAEVILAHAQPSEEQIKRLTEIARAMSDEINMFWEWAISQGEEKD